MKVAVVTIDKETISQHYGRSPYYKIFEIENNQINGSEIRERKTGHFAPGGHKNQSHHHTHKQGEPHGFSIDSQNKHSAMAAEISDCQVLIAGGMGAGAYENFKSAGLEVIMTNYTLIKEAIGAYLKGDLTDLRQERTL